MVLINLIILTNICAVILIRISADVFTCLPIFFLFNYFVACFVFVKMFGIFKSYNFAILRFVVFLQPISI